MNTAKLISIAEKAHYPFKAYPSARSQTILFPGCAFPSQFPRTMDALAQLCREAGFGVAYDCCGDPLEGFGKADAAERVLRNLQRRLDKLGCERLALVCPNCKRRLEGKLNCKLVGVFDVLDELGVHCSGSFGEGSLFIPCPDKKTRATETMIRAKYDMDGVSTIEHAPCCGLRPDLASKGTEYCTKLGRTVIEGANGGCIYSYCASCLGQFCRLGHSNCRHVVSMVLGIDETPDAAHALANRAKRKFDRNTNPL